jgi:hypothetical protein
MALNHSLFGSVSTFEFGEGIETAKSAAPPPPSGAADIKAHAERQVICPALARRSRRRLAAG